MAYVVSRPNGAWEIRESQRTDAGPRSRTLASFRELTPEVIETAQSRSAPGVDADELREAARRAGAPVADAPAEAAAAELLRRLSQGEQLRPELRRLVADAVRATGADPAAPSDTARAAAAWLGANAAERGRALRDLLLLADRFPARRRTPRPPYPRLVSAPSEH
jgi:hypothetical protein